MSVRSHRPVKHQYDVIACGRALDINRQGRLRGFVGDCGDVEDSPVGGLAAPQV